MSLTLRQTKGTKLTIPEMDNNFLYLESLSVPNTVNANPMRWLLGMASHMTELFNGSEWRRTLRQILDRGLVMPIAESPFTIPDNNLYMIASIEIALEYGEAVKSWTWVEVPTQVNAYASVEPYNKYEESARAWAGYEVNGLGDFSEKMPDFLYGMSYANLNLVLDGGMVEYNTIDGVSQLSLIKELMFSNNSISIEENLKYMESYGVDLLNVTNPGPFNFCRGLSTSVLDYGIVIYALDENYIISSVETILKYFDSYDAYRVRPTPYMFAVPL